MILLLFTGCSSYQRAAQQQSVQQDTSLMQPTDADAHAQDQNQSVKATGGGDGSAETETRPSAVTLAVDVFFALLMAAAGAW